MALKYVFPKDMKASALDLKILLLE